MKNSNRVIALIMMALMVFALCACSANNNDVSGKTETGTPSAAPENELELGVVSGGKYENGYFGFGCELDENWIYANEEQLLAMVQTTADLVNDADAKDKILDADMFYDMLAVYGDGTGSTTINVVVENIGFAYGTLLDEESMVEQTIKELPDQLKAASMEVQSCEHYTAVLGSTEHDAIYTHSTVNGTDIYQLQVFVKVGSYVAIVTLSSPLEDNIDAMLSFFYGV